ncbi:MULTISPECIES: hypothetical protein [Halobacterium]|uniref:hypothetical protein n=1 Tax=Halobacterium TaxID=2239 RepID=UPI001963628F|nr:MULTISPECIES: hypothetical protein [Halobacterium]MDL0119279.1 hypothetical protein [Halobacterium salinarum]MDL0121181.1 hypothetical protein [Halobacterium salinarum]MDL0126593.1 hypothetical protein [Halobacterium salinarum]MDL0137407.1 hypothetical protein [Halobacterium salinarum]MDL0143060.1 hypothetical protein [Halobacterium salinarum]
MADYDIAAVDLDGDSFEVRQALVRNKYDVRDADGEVVLKAKQKLFKLKEQFPFVTDDGDPAFTVAAGGILDIGGTYTIVDDTTGEDVVVLDEDYSLFAENWTIRDPDTGDALATIESRSTVLSALRHLIGVVNLVPNKYDIYDPEGRAVGAIEGQFSVKDTYTVTIDDARTIPKEGVVAAACVIDALENQ